MKFMASADLHISSKTPENRYGDYYGQVMKKFSKLLEITIKDRLKNLNRGGRLFRLKYCLTKCRYNHILI